MFTPKSEAFNNGGTIPEEYTERSVISPPPSYTQSASGRLR